MKKIKRIIILFLLLSTNNILLAQNRNVFSLPFPEQYLAIDKIIDTLTLQDSKFASMKISMLEKQAIETKNELCLLNFKRSEIRYRYIRTIGSEKRPVLDRLIKDTETLINQVDEEKYPAIEALLHFQIGNSLDYQKYNYKEQFKHYLQSYELFKKIPINLFPYRYYSQYAIALAYYQFGEYEKTIELCNEIETLFLKKDFNSILTVNLIGLSYLKLKNHKKAIGSFEWIFKNTKYALNPIAWKGISLCNLGSVYYSQEKNDKAIPYLKEGVEILKKEGILDNLAYASIILSKIYILQKNNSEAKKYIQIIESVNKKLNSLNISFSTNQILSDYYQLEGNSKLSLFHLQIANKLKDSLDNSKDIVKRFKAEMNFEKEKHLIDLDQIKNKMINQRVIQIILFLFAMLLIITLYVFYDRSKLKLKIQTQELEEKNHIIASELEMAYLKLEKFTKSKLQNEQIKNQKKIDRLSKNDTIVSKLVYETNLYTEKDWNEFKKLFEKAFPNYIQNIKNKLPKISASELRFMTVNKLNLNVNEMSVILNVSADAVRKSKKRLSKKIVDHLDLSFDEFKDSIL